MPRRLCPVRVSRFACQGSAKKGRSYCVNHLTIRQDQLGARALGDLASEILRDDMLAVFREEDAAETQRLTTVNEATRPLRSVELAEITRQLGTMR
jgi:hypothetical protein